MQIAPWVFPLTEETAAAPPRVRGKCLTGQGGRHHLGITPACAGKRYSPFRPRGLSWDHPRVCGEKVNTLSDAKTAVGSPPRVRGKGSIRCATAPTTAITPACAGKRLWPRRTNTMSQDHPRVCGEKVSSIASVIGFSGSPPRVRGKVCRQHRDLCRLGITPACAGKSFSPGSPLSPLRDHPRVCGEKVQPAEVPRHAVGSPPRVRGKAGIPIDAIEEIRITPACAGKSGKAAVVLTVVKDHPRVCGEKWFDSPEQQATAGSPPRVRGKGVPE